MTIILDFDEMALFNDEQINRGGAFLKRYFEEVVQRQQVDFAVSSEKAGRALVLRDHASIFVHTNDIRQTCRNILRNVMGNF